MSRSQDIILSNALKYYLYPRILNLTVNIALDRRSLNSKKGGAKKKEAGWCKRTPRKAGRTRDFKSAAREGRLLRC